MLRKLFLVFMFLFTTFNSGFSYNSPISKTIQLNSTNVLTIRGTIDDAVANKFVYDLNKDINRGSKYLYLDTNGGSVSAGARIVDEVEKYKLKCIAHKAYSMGFVILQACSKRYVTPYSSVMQHQISYGVANEKAKVESYVNFVDQVGEKLDKMQAKKIGLEYETFKKKTYNDWWLSGDNIVLENVADEMVNVKCSKRLTNTNYTISNGYQDFIYSSCPLVNEPIEVINNGNNAPPFVFWL